MHVLIHALNSRPYVFAAEPVLAISSEIKMPAQVRVRPVFGMTLGLKRGEHIQYTRRSVCQYRAQKYKGRQKTGLLEVPSTDGGSTIGGESRSKISSGVLLPDRIAL